MTWESIEAFNKTVRKYSLPLEAFEKPLKVLVQVVESCSKFHSRTFNAYDKVIIFAF